jgi:hypothetical protein
MARADQEATKDCGIMTAKIDEIGCITRAENVGFSHWPHPWRRKPGSHRIPTLPGARRVRA